MRSFDITDDTVYRDPSTLVEAGFLDLLERLAVVLIRVPREGLGASAKLL